MSVSRPAAAGDNAADPRSDRNLAQTSERCRSFFGASAAAAAITRSARRNSRLVNDTAAAAFLDALRAIDRSKDYTRRNGSRSDRDFHSMMTNSFVPCMQLALCFLSFRQIQSAAKTPLCQNCERPKNILQYLRLDRTDTTLSSESLFFMFPSLAPPSFPPKEGNFHMELGAGDVDVDDVPLRPDR